MSAVAAHALPATLDAHALQSVQSAIQMQFWHAIALVLTSLWMLAAAPASIRLANMAGFGFALGTVLFSGSIYLIVLAGIRLGPTAPAGGLLLIAAWLLLAGSALRAEPAKRVAAGAIR